MSQYASLRVIFCALASVLTLPACGVSPVHTNDADSATLDSVPAETWNALASRRVFFAHQSVGSNVAEGVAVLLAEHKAIPLRLIRSSNPDTISGGAIFHNNVGENGAPMSKTDGFTRIVLASATAPIDIAMQKFCYADFDKTTNPDSIFAAYVQRIEALRAERPNLQIVHVTTPLLERRFSLKDVARSALGRTTVRERMERVSRYNELLRRRYEGVDPIFALATLEAANSTDAPQSLAPEYATPDGGHLNALGERVAATHFLMFLATLPQGKTPS